MLLHQVLFSAVRELPVARSVEWYKHFVPCTTSDNDSHCCYQSMSVMGFPLANSRDQRITMPHTVCGHLCVSLALWIRFIYKVIRDLLSSGRTTTPMVTHRLCPQYTALCGLLWCWFKDLKQTEWEAGKIRQTKTGFPQEHFLYKKFLSLSKNSEPTWKTFSALTSRALSITSG